MQSEPPDSKRMASDLTVAGPIETVLREASQIRLGELPHCHPDPDEEILSPSVLTVALVYDLESKSVNRKPLAWSDTTSISIQSPTTRSKCSRRGSSSDRHSVMVEAQLL